MRYLEGGSKLTKDQTAEYLVHCKNIIKHPDQSIRNESKIYLLAKLYEYAKLVPHDKLLPDDKAQLNSSIDLIFNNIDQTEPDLRIVNAASLQLSILFTYVSTYNNGWVEPELSDFGINNNNIYQIFKKVTGSSNTKWDTAPRNTFANILIGNGVDWRIYSNIKLLFNWNELSNGIITILDYLTLDQIIVPYLNEWFICGLVYDKTYADGKLMVPFEFMHHDIIHYSNYDLACFNWIEQTPAELLAFYEYFCTLPHAYAIKVIFFMLIHESVCKWNKIKTMESLWELGAVEESRLFDDNDLGLLIPKPHRCNNETRITYLETAVSAYNDAITAYKDAITFSLLPQEHGGRKSKTKGQKTKRSKTKRSKTKRSKNKKAPRI